MCAQKANSQKQSNLIMIGREDDDLNPVIIPVIKCEVKGRVLKYREFRANELAEG